MIALEILLFVGIVLAITIVEAVCVIDFIDYRGLTFFNPIQNYEEWQGMNWFGVIFFTLLLNIIMPTLAFGYWFYKLCTVGRRK